MDAAPMARTSLVSSVVSPGRTRHVLRFLLFCHHLNRSGTISAGKPIEKKLSVDEGKSASLRSPKGHVRRLSFGTALYTSSRPALSVSTSISARDRKEGSLKTAPATSMKPSKIPSPLPPKSAGLPHRSSLDLTVLPPANPPPIPKRRMSATAPKSPAKPSSAASFAMELATNSRKKDEERRTALGLASVQNNTLPRVAKSRVRSLSSAIRTTLPHMNGVSHAAPSWIASPQERHTKDSLLAATVKRSTSPPASISSRRSINERPKISHASNSSVSSSSYRRSATSGSVKAVSFNAEDTLSQVSGYGASRANSLTATAATTAHHRVSGNREPSKSIPKSTSSISLSTLIVNGEIDGKSVISEPPKRRNRASIHDDASFASEPDRPRKRPSLTPQEVLEKYGDQLSPYERGEILEYPNIYYFGRLSRKQSGKISTLHNFGYDDERGDYLIHQHDHLQYRYEIVEVLGQGSFGHVVRARDHKKNEWVAIKIIRNKKRFHTQALVEVKILENLRKWDPNSEHNVVRMTDHFYFRNHLCISFECLSLNLYDFIKQNKFCGFSLGLIRRFSSQILRGLELLRRYNVIHCDLKPENILLLHPTKSAIKVIDFGSSCYVNERVYTYIQSRFYRSPEVILGLQYGLAIDMWSLGCIACELFTGHPLFPGEDESEQLELMMEVLGVPPSHIIEKSTRKETFFDSSGRPRTMQSTSKKSRKPGSKTLRQVVPSSDDRFLDFIARCLEWDPELRMSADQALRHDWVSDSPFSLKLKDAAMSAARNITGGRSMEDLAFATASAAMAASSEQAARLAASLTSSVAPVEQRSLRMARGQELMGHKGSDSVSTLTK